MQLQNHNSKVLTVNSDIIAVLINLQEIYKIKMCYSHQETGILITYERDKAFKRYCSKQLHHTGMNHINNGVQRGLKNRNNWVENWIDFMKNLN